MRPILALLLVLFVSPAWGCGAQSDCRVGERIYRIAMPAGDVRGAFLFLHGWKGTAAGVLRNRALVNAVTGQGYALVAPEAVGGLWQAANRPGGQRFSELPFFDALLEDLADRHAIPRENVVASGFSAGGMMVWNLICKRPQRFAAFAPIAGTYWSGPRDDCEGRTPPVLHIHGTADRTVPMNGRPIGDTRQGRVDVAMDHLRGFGVYRPGEDFTTPRLDCTSERDGEGDILALCLHAKGHVMPAEFAGFALKKLREVTRLP